MDETKMEKMNYKGIEWEIEICPDIGLIIADGKDEHGAYAVTAKCVKKLLKRIDVLMEFNKK